MLLIGYLAHDSVQLAAVEARVLILIAQQHGCSVAYLVVTALLVVDLYDIVRHNVLELAGFLHGQQRRQRLAVVADGVFDVAVVVRGHLGVGTLMTIDALELTRRCTQVVHLQMRIARVERQRVLMLAEQLVFHRFRQLFSCRTVFAGLHAKHAQHIMYL